MTTLSAFALHLLFHRLRRSSGEPPPQRQEEELTGTQLRVRREELEMMSEMSQWLVRAREARAEREVV